MRPVYETGDDRRRQSAVAALLERAWRCTLTESPPLAEYDYLASRDTVILGVLEIKARNRAAGDFGGLVFMDCRKRQALLDAASRYVGAAPVFVWRFTDQVRWLDVRSITAAAVETRGRVDRDGHDIHPAYRISVRDTRRVW